MGNISGGADVCRPHRKAHRTPLVCLAVAMAVSMVACKDQADNLGTGTSNLDLEGLPFSPCAFSSGEVLFGVEEFTRVQGKPEVFHRSFNVPADVNAVCIRVDNGAGGAARVSSATIAIDGIVVAGPNRWSQDVEAFVAVAAAESGDRSLQIEVRSRPQSSFTLLIEAARVFEGSGLIGPAGGTVVSEGGAVVVVPPGAVASPTQLSLTDVDASTAAASLSETQGTPEGFYPYGYQFGVRLEPESVEFDSSVIIGVPAQPPMPSQVLAGLARQDLDADGLDDLTLAGRAETNEQGAFLPLFDTLPFPGAVTGGLYLFLDSPDVNFVGGSVTGSPPVPDALVIAGIHVPDPRRRITREFRLFRTLTDDDGSFLLPGHANSLPTGAVVPGLYFPDTIRLARLHAVDPSGAFARVAGVPQSQSNALVHSDVVLAASPFNSVTLGPITLERFQDFDGLGLGGNTEFAATHALRGGDLDGDERPDILVAQTNTASRFSSDPISVGHCGPAEPELFAVNQDALYANESVTLDPAVRIVDVATGAPGSRQTDTHIADLDNDGDLDAISANGIHGIRVLVNLGGIQAGVEGEFFIIENLPGVPVASPEVNQFGTELPSLEWNDLAVGDLDGDGDLEVVVSQRINDFTLGITPSMILRNTGILDTSAGVLFPVFGVDLLAFQIALNGESCVGGCQRGDGAHDVEVADTDNDGKVDFLVLSNDFAEAPAEFARLESLIFRVGALGGLTRDVNAAFDPCPEGFPTPPPPGPPRGAWQHVGFADFDNDGVLDMHLGGYGSAQLEEIYLFDSQQDRFVRECTGVANLEGTRGLTTRDAAYGDIDLDGNIDIVLATSGTVGALGSSGPMILLGNGDGTFDVLTEDPSDFWPRAALAALFPGRPELESDFNAEAVDLIDIDSDGRLDIVFGTGDCVNSLDKEINRVFINRTPFAQTVSIPLAGAQKLSSIAVADFNGDGFDDFAVADVNRVNNNVTVIFGDGSGTFATNPPAFFSEGLHASAIAVAQVPINDLFGAPDLVIANEGGLFLNSLIPGSITLFENDGLGNFAFSHELVGFDGARGVAVADFGGPFVDSITFPDLAWTSNNNVHVVLATAPLYDESEVQTLPGAPGSFVEAIQASEIVAADLNGDGETDLLVGAREVADPSSENRFGQLLYYRGIGDGAFEPPTVLISGAQGDIRSISVVDVDGDMNLDVVAGGAFFSLVLGPRVLVFYGDGDPDDPLEDDPVVYSAGGACCTLTSTAVTSPTLGDLNGDGKLDFVVAYRDSSPDPADAGIVLYLSTATAREYELRQLVEDTNANDVALANVDADPLSEIVFVTDTVFGYLDLPASN